MVAHDFLVKNRERALKYKMLFDKIFDYTTWGRLIDIKNPSKETIDALTHLDIPSGVDIKIKL